MSDGAIWVEFQGVGATKLSLDHARQLHDSLGEVLDEPPTEPVGVYVGAEDWAFTAPEEVEE